MYGIRKPVRVFVFGDVPHIDSSPHYHAARGRRAGSSSSGVEEMPLYGILLMSFLQSFECVASYDRGSTFSLKYFLNDGVL